ncbi:MFS transporter [Micromonospora echinofusca]|uniref:MFS transporter n=1 Tax=Micromonospora echinofusca TaxID=47858 RepID=UPI003446EE0A
MSASATPPAADAPASAWAPLRLAAFRNLWLAVLASNVGTWMQTVDAQWLLVDEANASTLVSLVQTASMLPVLLLALTFALGELTSLVVALCVAAGAMAVGAASVPLWPLRETRGLDRDPAVWWPEPYLTLPADPRTGPVLVTVSCAVPPERQAEFVAAMRLVGRSRRRTGAMRWGLFRPGERADGYVEVYQVPFLDGAPAPARRLAHRRRPGGRGAGPRADRRGDRGEPPPAGRPTRLTRRQPAVTLAPVNTTAPSGNSHWIRSTSSSAPSTSATRSRGASIRASNCCPRTTRVTVSSFSWIVTCA